MLPGGTPPLLGFGLWSYPAIAAPLELVLVVGGTWLYRRRALAASRAEPKRANRAAIAISGAVTLALNVAGQ